MNNLSSYLTLLTFALLSGVFGQSISPLPGNYTTCPNERVVYTVNPNPNYSSCGNYTWTLTNGSFVNGQSVTSKTTSANNVDVYWNDFAGNGTLTVTSSCNQGTLNVSESYAIKSLAGRNLTNARALQTLPYFNTSTITLAI